MGESSFFRWLAGPELAWFFLYLVAAWLAKNNAAPPQGLDKLLENFYLWVPLAALLLVALWYLPIEKRWLLGRYWLAGLVGGHWVIATGLGGYSEQGPGIGTAYIVGMGLLFFALLAVTIFVLIRF